MLKYKLSTSRVFYIVASIKDDERNREINYVYLKINQKKR